MPEDNKTDAIGAAPTATQTRLNAFHNRFKEKHAGLAVEIDELHTTPDTDAAERNETIQHLLAELSELSISVLDAAPFLPTYDQRTCTERVRVLQSQLSEVRNAIQPKSKFAFKSRRTQGTTKKHEGATQDEIDDFIRQRLPLPPSQPKDSEAHLTTALPVTELRIAEGDSHSIRLDNSSPHPVSSAAISQLSGCIVNGFPASSPANVLSTVSLTNCQSTVLLLGRITGALHVTNLSNCVVVVVCGQLRMHECKDVDVHLCCSSNPVIEDCTGIRFAQIPEQFLEAQDRRQLNRWDQVLDFNWQKSSPSPHWLQLPQKEEVQAGMWEVLREGFASTKDSIKALLEHILPLEP